MHLFIELMYEHQCCHFAQNRSVGLQGKKVCSVTDIPGAIVLKLIATLVAGIWEMLWAHRAVDSWNLVARLSFL